MSEAAERHDRLDCDAVRDALQRGEPLTAELAAHVVECEVCGQLVPASAVLGEDPIPAAATLALFDRVEKDIAAEHGPVAWLRSRSTATRSAIAAGTIGALALAVLLFSARKDLHVYPTFLLWLITGTYVLLATALVPGALRGLHQPVLSQRSLLTSVALAVVVPFVVSAMPQAHTAHEASLLGMGDDFGKRLLSCFLYGLAVAAPALLMLRGLDRSGHSLLQQALLAASAAGVAGVLGQHLHCPITHPLHIVLGHGTLVAALVALYLLGSRVLRRRPA